VSQTLFAVTNIAAGLVTSNENVTNDDKIHCGIFNPGTRELFHDARSFSSSANRKPLIPRPSG
jgi:hypothetical protein